MSLTVPVIRKKDLDLKKAATAKRMRGVLALMEGYRLTYLWSTLAMGIAALAKTGTYLLLAYLIDDVLIRQDITGTLTWIGLGFVGLALVEGLFTFVSKRSAAMTAAGIVVRLRDFLYDHIQRLTFSYHGQAKTGDLIQRVTSDVDAIYRFFADQGVQLGRTLLLFIVNFAVIYALNARLAWFSVIIIPVNLVISLFFFRRLSDAYESFQDQEGRLSTTLQENLTGVRVVKAFSRGAYESEKFEIENQEQFRRGRRLTLMHAIFWPSTDILCGFQMVVGYLIAAFMVLDGTISIGTYLAYSGLVIWIVWPMRNLGRIIVDMSTGMISFDRVMKILKEDREELMEGIPVNQGIKGDISFENVAFEYDDGDRDVLTDISFSCKAGQAVALLGSTGSGKTTLVNLLPGFYEYTSGRILLDGVDLKSYSRDSLRRQIGIVEQEPFLFSRTIRDNITYGVDRVVSDEEVYEAARAAAVHDVILTFPEGYSTMIGERGVTLSGGQKQRIAIARTLLRDPRILILDDATSSVDSETEALIRKALENLMRGRTSFIIAHRIQSVMNADLILVMEDGRIIQSGTHEDLLKQDGIYRRVFDAQAQVESDLQEEMKSVGISA